MTTSLRNESKTEKPMHVVSSCFCSCLCVGVFSSKLKHIEIKCLNALDSILSQALFTKAENPSNDSSTSRKDSQVGTEKAKTKEQQQINNNKSSEAEKQC